MQTTNHGPAVEPQKTQQTTILKANNTFLAAPVAQATTLIKVCNLVTKPGGYRALLSNVEWNPWCPVLVSSQDGGSCFKCCPRHPLSTLAEQCTEKHIVRSTFILATPLCLSPLVQRSPFYLQYPPHVCQVQARGGCSKHRVSSFYDDYQISAQGGGVKTILWISPLSVNFYHLLIHI